jgi:hypothetical protein
MKEMMLATLGDEQAKQALLQDCVCSMTRSTRSAS